MTPASRAVLPGPMMDAGEEAVGAAERSGRYLRALDDAIRDDPAACVTPVYAEMRSQASESKQWAVVSLVRHAARNAEEARQLWSRAAGCLDAEARQHLKRSAVNLAVQATRHLTLLDLIFPGALGPDFRHDLDTLMPRYGIEDSLPDLGEDRSPLTPFDIASLNLFALRQTVLNRLQQASLARHCPEAEQAAATALFDACHREHLEQVAWTAAWLERAADRSQVADLGVLLSRALRLLNRDTMEEQIDLSYHQRFGNYP